MLSSATGKIGEILVREGRISHTHLIDALEKQKEVSQRLGEILVEMKAISEEGMISGLSSQIGIDVAGQKMLENLDSQWAQQIPETFAREHCLIPIQKRDNKLIVAMADPEDLHVLDTLNRLVNCEITPLLAGRRGIEKCITRVYETFKSSGQVSDVVSDLEFSLDERAADESIDLSGEAVGQDDAPVVKIVNLILANALRDRATDIHIEPHSKALGVRYRVDGALVQVLSVPMKSHSGVIARLKIMSKLNIAESRLPQDGRFTLKINNRSVDVRVSILPSILGEKIVMRLLDQSSFDLRLANLGMAPELLRRFVHAINRPYGIVIITGPTGAGKSTTLYAALNEIKSDEDNIITVEDPVEYQLEGITQVAVNDKIDLTFGRVLRSVLRQDPDKLLIGEIRDQETADIAMKFALTGHLVFTTLHANDTATTITRLIDIGMPRFLVGSSVVMVMAQRLVRTICPHCKESYTLTDLERELLQLSPDQLKVPLFQGRGCTHCKQTGYFGRTGIFEMMPITSALRHLIFDGADQQTIEREALSQGMCSLRQSCIEKMLLGETTAREVLKHTVEGA